MSRPNCQSNCCRDVVSRQTSAPRGAVVSLSVELLKWSVGRRKFALSVIYQRPFLPQSSFGPQQQSRLEFPQRRHNRVDSGSQQQCHQHTSNSPTSVPTGSTQQRFRFLCASQRVESARSSPQHRFWQPDAILPSADRQPQHLQVLSVPELLRIHISLRRLACLPLTNYFVTF